MKKIFFGMIITSLICPIFNPSYGAEKKQWVTLEYQFDTRNFNTLNVMGFSDLPGGFAISGFTDFEGAKNSDSRSYDLVTHFTEIDLRTSAWHGVALISELNSATGSDNDLGRFGLFYKPELVLLKELNLFLFFKGFPVETDGEGGQVNFTWNKNFPNIFAGRFSLGGFFDLNLESGPDSSSHIISDTQFRLRLIENLYFLVEYRHNDFLSSDKKHGVGIGIKYHF